MELEQDRNTIHVELGSPTFVGRERGLKAGSSSSDRTISRRHVSLQFLDTKIDMVDNADPGRELLLSFEVIGKNPIFIISKDGKRKRVYKKSEKGVLTAGDSISLSIKNPNFFLVKRREKRKEEAESGVLDAVARRERRTLQRRKEEEERVKLEEAVGEDEVVWEGSGLEIGSLDISEIDPVKEFGFLVRGHEFDHYPRHKILPFKDWNWFLEDTWAESSEDGEEDEAIGTKLKGKTKRQKKKKGGNADDEDWIEENDDKNNLVAKALSAKQIRISTRSKDLKKPHNTLQNNKMASENKFISQEKEVDNEEDETLGGFIVGDDDMEENEMLEEESEEEEEDEDDEGSDVD